MSQESQVIPGGLSPDDQGGLQKPRIPRFSSFVFSDPLRSSPEIHERETLKLSYTINVDASCFPRGMIFTPGKQADRQQLIKDFEQEHPDIPAISRIRRNLQATVERREPGLHHGRESQYALGETPIVGKTTDNLEVSLDNWTRTRYMYGRILGGHENRAVPQYAQAAGTDIVWLTTEEDGSHKLVLLLRHEGNGNYGGTGGIVAGGWDMKRLDEAGKQVLGYSKIPPTMESAKENILHETAEEACIPTEKLKDVDITFLGISTDNILEGHKGILAMGILPVSSRDITRWQMPVLDRQVGATYDFSDPAAFFDANPQTIATILTQDKTVITPETKANLHLVGKRMVYQQSLASGMSQEEAEKNALQWEDQLIPGIKKAEDSIDQQVTHYYSQNPEAKKNKHWIKSSRRDHFHPSYDVKSQGLHTARKGFNRAFGTHYI